MLKALTENVGVGNAQRGLPQAASRPVDHTEGPLPSRAEEMPPRIDPR